MKKLEDVGNVIAERELELADGRTVQVVIGQPQLFPEGGSFYCPIRITGIGKEKIMRVGGVDSVQALVLALQAIDAHLFASLGAPDGILNWLGQQVLESPVPSSLQNPDPKDGE